MLSTEDCLRFKYFTDRHQRSFYYPLSRRILNDLKSRPNPIIVDLGTGPGYLTLALAEQTQGWIRSVDINPAMHDLAREILEGKDLRSKVTFELADVHALPFEDASVDAIVSYTCFHHYADPVRALVECERVLKPGGLILFIDGQPISRATLQTIFAGLETGHERAIVAKAYQEAFSQYEVREFLRRAGIDDYELSDFRYSPEELMDSIDDLDESNFQADEKKEALMWALKIRREEICNTIA